MVPAYIELVNNPAIDLVVGGIVSVTGKKMNNETTGAIFDGKETDSTSDPPKKNGKKVGATLINITIDVIFVVPIVSALNRRLG